MYASLFSDMQTRKIKFIDFILSLRTKKKRNNQKDNSSNHHISHRINQKKNTNTITEIQHVLPLRELKNINVTISRKTVETHTHTHKENVKPLNLEFDTVFSRRYCCYYKKNQQKKKRTKVSNFIKICCRWQTILCHFSMKKKTTATTKCLPNIYRHVSIVQ